MELAEKLAQEFALECVHGNEQSDDLFDWLCHHKDLSSSSWEELKVLEVRVSDILDYRVTIVIK
jgi:hypothetical protein